MQIVEPNSERLSTTIEEVCLTNNKSKDTPQVKIY